MAKKPIKPAKKAAKKAAPKKVVKVAPKAAPKKAAKKSVPAKKAVPVKKIVKKAIPVKKKAVPVKKTVPVKKVTNTGRQKQLPAPQASKPVVKGKITEQKKTAVAAVVSSVATSKKKNEVAEYDPNGWSKLTQSQKKVFISTAALKHMERGDIQIRKGDYIFSPSLASSISKLKERTDFIQMLENASDVQVCGAGILLYADILFRGGYHIFNNAKLNEISLKDIGHRLDYFSTNDLKMIETAFETFWAFSESESAGMPAIIFGQRFSDLKRRLSAILNNIIENEGSFKPQ